MNDHRMAPRTADEDRLLSGPVDANDLDRVRKRLVAVPAEADPEAVMKRVRALP